LYLYISFSRVISIIISLLFVPHILFTVASVGRICSSSDVCVC
jgi:hypothetical protein